MLQQKSKEFQRFMHSKEEEFVDQISGKKQANNTEMIKDLKDLKKKIKEKTQLVSL
jgi:hypothetical protein